MTWFNRFVSWLRNDEPEQVRSYEGASKGRRMQNWVTRSTDANAELYTLPVLRDRSRDLVRNNAWAARAVQVISTNTVGAGIIPQATGPNKKRKQTLYEQWGETAACDADGLLTLYGLQNLWMRAVAESGEVFIRRRWRRGNDDLPVPMQIQTLESDYLDTMKEGVLANGGKIIQGIEYDPIGRRAAYWLYDNHPGSVLGRSAVSRRVPANDVIHLYRMDRPNQGRGVPWCAPVMVRLRDLADWQDNKLFRSKIAACFTAFVYDTYPGGATEDNGDLIDTLEPGNVEYLTGGKQVAFANPPSAGGEESYVADELRAIAAAFGITYEALSGNLSGVNFSSGRMGWIEMHRNIESWRWNMLIPQALDRVWRWFDEAAFMGLGYPNNGVIWTPPRREMIDPAKEIKWTVEQIRNGLISHSEAIRSFGFDPDQLLNELAADMKRLDKLGLTLDINQKSSNNAGRGEQDADED